MKSDKAKSRKVQDTPLPPWGQISVSHLEGVEMDQPPPDWMPPAGAAGDRNQAWVNWRAAALAEIADVLWPILDVPALEWQGNSVGTMEELTKTDLDLMFHLNRQQDSPLNQQPSHKSKGLWCPNHREFFEAEDSKNRGNENLRFAQDYKIWDRDISEQIQPAKAPVLPEVSPMRKLFFLGLKTKDGNSAIQFKTFFQRPRPYQTAMIFGRAGFFHLSAYSSDTPSMQSGHALQGLLGVGGMMERLLTLPAGIEFDAANLNALQQLAVDIGDRRVMAGVHYPSDNIGSWILAMKMADRVYRNPKVKTHLWSAIKGQSFVYQEIKAWIAAGKGDVYKPALKLLENAAK